MADYSNPGEFQGTLGQGQGLWAVLEGNTIFIRPQVVIAGTTSTATQGQSVDTWSGAPPAGAFAIPVWNLGPSGGGAGSNVTVLNSGGAFGTISTSRTWTLSSAGDSVTAHLDAPISVAATTTAKATAADPSYAEGVDSPISQDLSGHLRTLAAVTVPQPLAVNSMQSTGRSAFPWFVNVLSSAGVSATQVGTWTVQTSTSVGTVLVNQGTNPWTVINQTSVGTVLVLQGGAPWSVTNLTSVGTVTTTPLGSVGVSATIVGQPISVTFSGTQSTDSQIQGSDFSTRLSQDLTSTSAGGLITNLAVSTSAGGLVRLAVDFGAIMARIKNKQFMDNEEVRYDVPTLLASGASYVGLSSSGSATASNAWHIIRTDFDSNANPNRDRIRFGSWDNRAVGWT